MPRFFLPPDRPLPQAGDIVLIAGPDAQHISRALRMKTGEALTLCDGKGGDYACEITGFEGENVLAKVLSVSPSSSEPSLRITLFQGFPKGEKLELVIQKAVELGVTAIVPVVTARSIAKPSADLSKSEKKRDRWQKISAEAAGQCGRGVIPAVEAPISFREMLDRIDGTPTIVFYEGGGESLSALVSKETKALSLIVGPEGGFDPSEIAAIRERGGKVATLGPRILRCETAPLVALAAIMTLTGNLD